MRYEFKIKRDITVNQLIHGVSKFDAIFPGGPTDIGSIGIDLRFVEKITKSFPIDSEKRVVFSFFGSSRAILFKEMNLNFYDHELITGVIMPIMMNE